MAGQKYYYSVGRCESDSIRQVKIKIMRSLFTCSLAYTESMAGAKAFISKVSKENKTATHNCWAYVVGERAELFHCSDAGEPSGTAGKPMLNTLFKYNMTNVAAVVTRQYGGVKLGVRGLIEAYSDSVASAVEAAPLVRLVKTLRFRVSLPYGFNDTLLSRIGQFGAVIFHTEYTDQVVHGIEVETMDGPALEHFLEEYQNQNQLEFEPYSPD